MNSNATNTRTNENTGKVLLLANCRVEQVVLDEIEHTIKYPVELKYIDSTGVRGINGIRRHWSYWRLAWSTFFRADDYRMVIFWQQFIAIYFALLKRIFFLKKLPQAIVLTFIYIQRRGLKGRLHRWIYKNTVSLDFIRRIVCHSTTEVNAHGKGFGPRLMHKFVFLPIGEGVDDLPFESSTGDYYFAGGSSNRNFKLLTDVFKANDKKLLIACQPSNLSREGLPPNIEVRYDLYGDQFLEKMAGAKAVLIPLKDPEVSSGQLVLLNAMRLRKYSVVSGGAGLRDYVSEEYCFLVKNNSFAEWLEAVNRLDNQQDILNNAGLAGYRVYKKAYDYRQYGKNIGKLAQGLLNEE